VNKKIIFFLLELLAVGLFAAFFCFWNLGSQFSFGVSDETIHSQVANEMVHNGTWFNPTRYGHAYNAKPPFKMWFVGLVVKWFGQSNFSYRMVDACIGVMIALLVFLFAKALFKSRLTAFLSVLALLGCTVFLWAHGVRLAVQDGMLLLLSTGAIVCGWYYCQRLEQPLRSRLPLATAGGFLVGLAVLTKIAAGFITFCVLGPYVLLSGKVPLIWRKALGATLLIAAISVAVPALYFIPREISVPGSWNAMFNQEVVDRALTGYHFSASRCDAWYYYKDIVKRHLSVPPELFFVGICFALFAVIRRRDERYLFLLCWAFVPLVLYTIVKWKASWYIMPAFPAMSMLIGAVVTAALTYFRDTQQEWKFVDKSQRSLAVVCLLFGIYAIGALAFYAGDNVRFILTKHHRTPPDKIAHHILADHPGQRPLALRYKMNDLVMGERLYADMLGVKRVEEESELEKELATGNYRLLITPAQNFDKVAAMRPISGYKMLPPKKRMRDQWLSLISYEPGEPAPWFVPANRTIDFSDKKLSIAYGWDYPIVFNGLNVRLSNAPRAGIIVPISGVEARLGSRVTLRYAPTSIGFTVKVFINDILSAQFPVDAVDFRESTFLVPPNLWQEGKNLLSFVFEPPPGVPAPPGQVIFQWANISLNTQR
jgi:4-amino-4-deoxy-L-arabinose transferase-like glycosyltransferase